MKAETVVCFFVGIILLTCCIGIFLTLSKCKDDTDVLFSLLFMFFSGFGSYAFIADAIQSMNKKK